MRRSGRFLRNPGRRFRLRIVRADRRRAAERGMRAFDRVGNRGHARFSEGEWGLRRACPAGGADRARRSGPARPCGRERAGCGRSQRRKRRCLRPPTSVATLRDRGPAGRWQRFRCPAAGSLPSGARRDRSRSGSGVMSPEIPVNGCSLKTRESNRIAVRSVMATATGRRERSAVGPVLIRCACGSRPGCTGEHPCDSAAACGAVPVPASGEHTGICLQERWGGRRRNDTTRSSCNAACDHTATALEARYSRPARTSVLQGNPRTPGIATGLEGCAPVLIAAVASRGLPGADWFMATPEAFAIRSCPRASWGLVVRTVSKRVRRAASAFPHCTARQDRRDAAVRETGLSCRLQRCGQPTGICPGAGPAFPAELSAMRFGPDSRCAMAARPVRCGTAGVAPPRSGARLRKPACSGDYWGVLPTFCE